MLLILKHMFLETFAVRAKNQPITLMFRFIGAVLCSLDGSVETTLKSAEVLSPELVTHTDVDGFLVYF